MLPVSEEPSSIFGSRLNNPSSITWFYLSFEFIVALSVSGFLAVLVLIKSMLPKPPRNISGDVVLITGATSDLGQRLSEEFLSHGCTVVCVDEVSSEVEALVTRLRSAYPQVERIGPDYRRKCFNQDDDSNNGGVVRTFTSFWYSCDLSDQAQIKGLASRVRAEIGGIGVLVVCSRGTKGPKERVAEVFDSFSQSLMSYYWTVLAFLPMMLHRDKAHVVGITPTSSRDEAHMGTKAAISGLMDSLRSEFGGRNRKINFMTVAPNADPRIMHLKDEEIARNILKAIQRDISFISVGWSSKFMYNFSCKVYGAITRIVRWFDA